MMKKMWKNRKGVSPVIATILMVAITVVLAAVLYVMVMGFGGSGGGQAPAVTLTNSATDKVIININPATAFGELKFSVESATPIAFANNANCTSGSISAVFSDAGTDGKVTSGDYFTVYGSGTLKVFWVNGDTTQLVNSIAF